MLRRPFLVFSSVVGALIIGVILFIQSAQFAGVAKKASVRYLPKDMGVNIDFSEFKIKLFPPGISVQNPRVTVGPHNIVNLPPGSSVRADQIELIFRPFQMFTGNIRIHEAKIINGDVELLFDPNAKKEVIKKKTKLGLHWDELLQVHAEAVALENTRIHVRTPQRENESANSGDSADFKGIQFLASYMRLAQWSGEGGLGYELALDLSEMHGTLIKDFPIQNAIEKIRMRAQINAKGVQLDELALTAKGLEASASGFIRGNILQPTTLPAEGHLQIKGDIGELLTALQLKKMGSLPSGKFNFDGKVKVDLLKTATTLRAEGNLDVEDAKYQAWHAKQTHIEGVYSSLEENEILIKKMIITEPESPRTGANHPGSGGRVEVNALRIPLGKVAPIQVDLKLAHAHLHWLAAPVLKSIYALDLRVSGPVQAIFNPTTKKLQANLGLVIEHFQLDNQKLGQVKPLHKVFEVPEIKLTGPLLIDAAAVRPEGVVLSLPHTELHLGGKIDFKTGYDLTAKGRMRLSDLGTISETAVRGDGTISTHVHGPTNRVLVDNDLDAKNSFYLGLNLGDFKGRVTWDDDPNHLVFSQVQLAQSKTSYTVNGLIDLGKQAHVALAVGIVKGDVADFITIFDQQTRNLAWFPHSLNGNVSGTVAVSGGLGMDQLKIATRLNGSEWEFLGERFKQVVVSGGYDEGKYYLQNFNVTKRSGRFGGRLSYDQKNRFDWEILSQDMSVSDFDHVARLDVPIRGKFNLVSSGQGPIGDLASKTEISVTDVVIRGVGIAASELRLKSEGSTADLKSDLAGGEGNVEAHYDFNPKNLGYIRAEIRHFDFTPFILLLNPSLIKDPALQGYASGKMKLGFYSDRLQLAKGSVELNEYLLAKTGVKFALVHPVSFRPTEGNFEIADLVLRGGAGESVLNLKSQQSKLSGSIAGDTDLAIAEFFSSSVAKARGTAALDVSIGGTLVSPEVYGRVAVSGGSLQVPSLDSPFENITGSLQLRQNILSIQNIVADLAGGNVSVDGTIALFATHASDINLKAQVNGSKLKVFPFQYAKVHGNVAVHGNEIPYLVDGKITVDSALSTEKVFSQKSSGGVKAVQYGPPPSKNSDTGYPKFKLKIEVNADRGIFVKNNLFDAEAKAHITVVNTLEAPRIIGFAEIVQGKILFKDKNFTVQSGSVEFDNPTLIDPILNLNANAEISGFKIQMLVSRRLSDFKIDLSSTPVLPDSEILSLLTLGVTSSDTKRLTSNDRTVFEQGEAASLLLHSFDFNREVENKTGIQIQLDEAVNSQQGTSIFKAQNSAPDSAAPRLVIKRRIGKNLDFSYGSTLGVGSNNAKEVNGEIHVTPGLSVIGVWDNYETVDSQDNRTSYGLDLKLQKRFK